MVAALACSVDCGRRDGGCGVKGRGAMVMMTAVVVMVLGGVGESYFSKSYIQYPRTSFQQYQ